MLVTIVAVVNLLEHSFGNVSKRAFWTNRAATGSADVMRVEKGCLK